MRRESAIFELCCKPRRVQCCVTDAGVYHSVYFDAIFIPERRRTVKAPASEDRHYRYPHNHPPSMQRQTLLRILVNTLRMTGFARRARGHDSAPVENAESEDSRRRTKSKHLFSLIVRYRRFRPSWPISLHNCRNHDRPCDRDNRRLRIFSAGGRHGI